MYTVNGRVKCNKKDIEGMRVFLSHAKQDMSYRGCGTYTDDTLDDNLDKKEFAKGVHGLMVIESILKVLCDKWN